MNNIKCPNCGESFSIDDAHYAAIAQQVRNDEFDREVAAQTETAVRLAKAEKDKEIAALEQQLRSAASERELAVREAIDAQQRTINDKEQQIISLNARIDEMKKVAAAEKEAAVESFKQWATLKVTELQTQLANADADKAIAVQAVEAARAEEQHRHELQVMELNNKMTAMQNDFALMQQQTAEQNALILKQKDEEIAYYKDMKTRLSTKMLGETLEQHCEVAFNGIRSAAFPGAYFEKDSDVSLGTKGDYIFRDFDENGDAYISIMFDMKNEADETATKHKNEDFLKKLDKDRNDKQCEYAILVSMLEPDSELYNAGIVDMSHRYPKMYVIRPQFFIPLICLLRDMARSSLSYRRELRELKQQDLDIERFTERLQTFKDGFAKNVQQASDRFDAAIKEIDNSIDRLQKAKASLLLSGKHLLQANSKAEDLTIKRLTAGSPALAQKFLDAGCADEKVSA